MTIETTGPLASITFDWGGKRNLRVYFQDTAGWVRENMYDGSSWSKGNGGNPMFEAAKGSNIAASTWMDNGNPQIRIYYMAPSGELKEFVYSGKWGDGSSLPQ